VTPKIRAWLLVLTVAALCGASVWGVVWYRSRALTPAAMLRRMPAHDALVLYIDFSQLRRGGILTPLDGSKVGEDPEYKAFVRQTEFDYTQDLDAALIAFAPGGKYMLIRGRFEWKSLFAYAVAQGGRCNNTFCRMPGSTPDRLISFFPVQGNLMALAVANDESAAMRMSQAAAGPDPEIPNALLWLSIPPSVVKSGQKLPDSTLVFAQSLEQAEAATVSVVSEGKRYAAKLDVRCGNDRDAALMRSELAKATAALGKMLELDRQKPDPLGVPAFMASGSFRNEGRRVFGYWPIEFDFVKNMLGGS
jgi:hypothetical protein